MNGEARPEKKRGRSRPPRASKSESGERPGRGEILESKKHRDAQILIGDCGGKQGKWFVETAKIQFLSCSEIFKTEGEAGRLTEGKVRCGGRGTETAHHF